MMSYDHIGFDLKMVVLVLCCVYLRGLYLTLFAWIVRDVLHTYIYHAPLSVLYLDLIQIQMQWLVTRIKENNRV